MTSTPRQGDDETPRELPADRLLEAMERRRTAIPAARRRGVVLEEKGRPSPPVQRRGDVVHTACRIGAWTLIADP